MQITMKTNKLVTYSAASNHGSRIDVDRHECMRLRDFEGAHIDARVRIQKSEPVQPERPQPAPATQTNAEPIVFAVERQPPELIAGAAADPAFRVSRLLPSNSRPLSVSPDCTLNEAVTLMLRHNYSQLPVMTNERDVKGIVSWETIGPRLAIRGTPVQFVRECMKPHFEVLSTDLLFRVIGDIVENSYVLVRGEDRTITGILTTTDLSLQFQQMAEPFLLLGEIENHIRSLIDGKFTREELGSIKDSADDDRAIESVADLTLGEYIRLLGNPEFWTKSGLRVDRKVFTQELDRVRQIRNDVMHFDPDGITSKDHALLRNFLHFLHELRAIGA